MRIHIFSLRTLMAIMMLCAVAGVSVTTLGLEPVAGFSGLAWSCALVLVLASALVPFDGALSRLPSLASFVVSALLYCTLAFTFFFLDAAIDKPHPAYLNDRRQVTDAWLIVALADAAKAVPFTAGGVLVLIAINEAVPTSGPKDRAYYPRLLNVWRGLGLPHIRLLLIAGVLLVVGYYALTVVEVSSRQKVCGVVWPPSRVWITCHFLWGLLWLADCASRPHRGMMDVAIGYLCITLLFLLLFGFGTIGT
jgi:hypothetical protein